MKSTLAIITTALLFIVLPLGGAIGGSWAATTYAAPEPMETPERACGLAVIPQFLNDVVATSFVGLVGAGLGLGIGVLIAFRAASAISERFTSVRRYEEDDE